jgi:hypothetical protein
MTILLALLVGAALAIAVDTLFVAVFRARPIGTYRVLRQGTAIFEFESDLGRFTILPREGKLHYKSRKDAGTLTRAEIKGLEYRVREEVAMLEEIFFGLDLTDRLARYVDTIDWFSLTVVAHDGRRVRLFLSGQYTPREFALTWYIEWQAQFLQALGVLKDVEAQSRAVMEQLRSLLGDPPLL